MSPDQVQILLDLRLNKLASETYTNIECWEKREAVNKALLEWVRRQIHGTNLSKEGDEESKMRVDDLQILLKEKNMNLEKKDLYFITEEFPKDYGWFKTIRVYGNKDKCKDVLISDLHHIEEANVNEWLNDWSKIPSFEYRQSFYTITGNKIKIYTNNDFDVSKVNLIYYRFPKKFDIKDCEHYNGSNGIDQEIEFKDDIAQLIIDEAASILAADIEHQNAYQTTIKRKEENN
jgi:hypothetical protein